MRPEVWKLVLKHFTCLKTNAVNRWLMWSSSFCLNMALLHCRSVYAHRHRCMLTSECLDLRCRARSSVKKGLRSNSERPPPLRLTRLTGRTSKAATSRDERQRRRQQQQQQQQHSLNQNKVFIVNDTSIFCLLRFNSRPCCLSSFSSKSIWNVTVFYYERKSDLQCKNRFSNCFEWNTKHSNRRLSSMTGNNALFFK